MRAQRLDAGFSTADTGYPSVTFAPGVLTVTYASSAGQPVLVDFTGVAAFAWQEDDDDLLPDEPWDGVCELFDSPLLAAHPPGKTFGAVAGLRHIRLHFNVCGRLDVLCTAFARRG